MPADTAPTTLLSDWAPLAAGACALGESPCWHAGERRLYWVDIAGRRLLRADARGEGAEAWSLPSEPGCIAPAHGGGLVIALRSGIFRARVWGGALDSIAVLPCDPATTRANDGKCDAHGRFWVGTVYEPKDAPRAALYSIDARGSGPAAVREQVGGALTANSLAWSPDGRTLYWADTPSHAIHAWDFDAETAALSNRRLLRAFDPKPAGWQAGDPGYGGRPDGAAVDAEGHLWVAMFEGARVLRLSPDGAVAAEYPLPVRCPTMPAFGGADGRTLFVTSAAHGRSAQELAALPLSGRVLSLRVDVPGLPVNLFRG
ncbi:SMP-30/gluconolactonase/LRE family protein [Xylophilus sp.]|uniref:SMP-30/gluconolactonase/LRE family protein n=1 Tax=Xylophilus sp. TaxID=2653893 RepID=UPI0013BB6EF4|nr:SMP-30/gluconolactonase/LRE family protein [Xylophilus sp.]KAF1050291.1 MAG: 6-deoxy-6-sulfogluconolactonase [Xylophilus sp.]